MDAQHGVHSRHNKMDALPADAVFSAIESVEVALAGIDRTRSSDVIRRREAETILSRLADVPVAILIANGRARYVEVNAAAATLTGYTRSELLRMSVWNLTPEANQTQGISAWEGFLRDRRQSGVYQLRRKDGTLVRTTYLAIAHVLPGLHLSALATRELVRRLSRSTRHLSRLAP
jgi:PAS domain S-box-containing protein